MCGCPKSQSNYGQVRGVSIDGGCASIMAQLSSGLGGAMPENAMQGADAPAPRWGRVVQVLSLIFSLYVIEQAVEAVLWDTGHLPGAGYIGTDHAGFTPTAECGAGCVRVDQVARGSPLAEAGVAAGDHIRLDNTLDRDRHVRAGDRLDFALKRGDGWAHHEVIAIPIPKVDPKTSWTYVTYDLLTVSTSLFGILIIWRSGGRRTPLLLGLALMCFGLIDSWPQMWEEAYGLFETFATINVAVYSSIFVFFAAFSISFAVEAANLKLGKIKYVFLAFIIVFYAVGFWREYAAIRILTSSKLAYRCHYILQWAFYLASLIYMYMGWKRSGSSERRRYTLMLVAFTMLVLAQILTEFVGEVLGVQDYAANPLELVAATMAGVIAPALFAYAILRHKVFDLGFALNRTLVYGVVSAILLAAFGLIEWAVDHLVPIEGREKNALVDAAIAVVVFLAFHRVRDVVEHGVEALFFRRWQRAEQDLRRFVREAAFFTEASALTNALVEALCRFGEGAQAAVYLEKGRGYALAAGALEIAPAVLEPDLPALVSLRADPKLLEAPEDLPSAALIAPMVNRNEVIGLVMLGAKLGGDSFRPDEIELIGWAVRQVGLDLHALRMEQLEASRVGLSNTVAMLQNEIATLRSIIPQRT
jgi:hypothetical protein